MTILNDYIHLEKVGITWGWSSTSILGIVFGILAIMLIIIFINDNIIHNYNCDSILAGFCICLIFILITIFSWRNVPVYKEIPYYEVILTDDYSAKDLLNNYEIVEQHGDILVLKDKVLGD